MTDAIVVSDLVVPALIGVFEEERSQPQNVVVSFEVRLDLRSAGESDDLADTLDYGALVADVAGVVGARPVNLIEHLAERIATFLSGLPRVEGVTVEVAKEQAPIPEDVGRVSMRVER